jgi:hypothetical protein
MQTINFTNQIAAFLLEITMYVSLGYFGFRTGKNTLEKYGFALVLPSVAMTLWGLFAAPLSAYRIDLPFRILFELVLFLTAAYSLFRTGKRTLAIIFAGIAILSEVLAVVFTP